MLAVKSVHVVQIVCGQLDRVIDRPTLSVRANLRAEPCGTLLITICPAKGNALAVTELRLWCEQQ